MKKFILRCTSFDECTFYAFESDKTVGELNKELPIQSEAGDFSTFEFQGFKDLTSFYHYRVFELEEFWGQYTLENYNKRLAQLREL